MFLFLFIYGATTAGFICTILVLAVKDVYIAGLAAIIFSIYTLMFQEILIAMKKIRDFNPTQLGFKVIGAVTMCILFILIGLWIKN